MDSTQKARLAELIKRLRQETAYAQKDLAARLGVESGTISRYESGEQGVPPSSVAAIAKLCLRIGKVELAKEFWEFFLGEYPELPGIINAFYGTTGTVNTIDNPLVISVNETVDPEVQELRAQIDDLFKNYGHPAIDTVRKVLLAVESGNAMYRAKDETNG